MKNLIAFDIGTAKVVAVLGVVSKNGVLEKKSEVVLGSFPIIKDKK